MNALSLILFNKNSSVCVSVLASLESSLCLKILFVFVDDRDPLKDLDFRSPLSNSLKQQQNVLHTGFKAEGEKI
jgi:hypothetical protein